MDIFFLFKWVGNFFIFKLLTVFDFYTVIFLLKLKFYFKLFYLQHDNYIYSYLNKKFAPQGQCPIQGGELSR